MSEIEKMDGMQYLGMNLLQIGIVTREKEVCIHLVNYDGHMMSINHKDGLIPTAEGDLKHLVGSPITRAEQVDEFSILFETEKGCVTFTWA